ncbi:MAG: SPOR domain-containing protein [Bacteroidota bacterium]|nr:SPOR domain-containing protein [Bacteroidota bacterium]
MKHYFPSCFPLMVSILLLGIALVTTMHAQSPQKQRNEILKELNATTSGQGRVAVHEDESIRHVLGRPMSPTRTVYTSADGTVQFHRMRGFKVQAFSGNNQRTSKDEAHRKQAQINAAFPEHETVVLFDSPFWRLRVGNFATREEAEEAMQEFRKRLPSFGREMYIVVDEVKIPINQAE